MQQVPHFPVVVAEAEIRIIGPGVLIILSPLFLDGITVAAEQRITGLGIIAVIEGNRFEFVAVQIVFQHHVAGVAKLKAQSDKVLDGNVHIAPVEGVRPSVQNVQRHGKRFRRAFHRLGLRAECAQQQT